MTASNSIYCFLMAVAIGAVKKMLGIVHVDFAKTMSFLAGKQVKIAGFDKGEVLFEECNHDYDMVDEFNLKTEVLENYVWIK